MSQFQSLGLTIEYYQPAIDLPASYDPEGTYLGTLATEVSSYGHSTGAFGGYLAASLGLQLPRNRVDEWLAYGLNRTIVVYNPNLTRIWEGFVNQVTVNLGPLTVTRGPLLDIGNRVSVNYTQIANTTDARPSTTGQAVTPIADDPASQLLYGIVERVENGGQLTDADALALRATFLAENAWPAIPEAFSSAASEPGVTLECLGHLAKLNTVVFNDATAGFVSVSTKLAAILDADPNLLFSSANADLYLNPLIVPAADEQDRMALAVIQELVALGGAGAARTLWGAYNNRRIAYALAPTTIEYNYALADPGMRITTPPGLLVRPWDVLPGRFCLYTDFLIGATIPGVLRSDPRCQFIEQANFTAPYDLTLDGSRVSTIPQMLAQYGLAGAAA